MKRNFIVSGHKRLWIEGSKQLFIIEPFIYYQLKTNGDILSYEDVIVAPYRRQSGADLQKDHDFVQIKYKKYAPILAERLNQTHGTSYSTSFWKRALSLSLDRYITFLHEVFENCELHFNAREHDCCVLSKKSYHVPLDFDDQRSFFQHSNYGQEQIFSIYMHTFYPSGLKTKDDKFKKNGNTHGSEKHLILRLLKQNLSKAFFEKVKAKLLEKYYSRKIHKIGIMGSFFSATNLSLLMTKSKGAIYPLEWQTKFDHFEDNSFLWDSRKHLTENQFNFDRFDLFFFASLEHCFPRIFIESFKKVEHYWVEHFQRYKGLEFVISEAWLSNNNLCIALALLKEKGVRHIYNEHNYFEHPWVGSLIPKEAALSDIFVSLGWDTDNITNLVKGASLREFKLNERPEKRYKICYFSSIPLVKRPNYTSSYGESAENAPRYIEFVRSFFENLNCKTINEILFRGYPETSSRGWLYYDLKSILDIHLQSVKKFDNTSTSSKLLMLQSDLVIVDYISTAYLESISMNIPTIFFFNPATYHLSHDYSDFFDLLISVGICQTDPIAAAHFVENVNDNPMRWWTQNKVQKAKDDFLRKNMEKPEVMISFLLGLLKSN